MTWVKIDCKRSDELRTSLNLCVVSSRSDLGGMMGDPSVQTTWGDRETETEVLNEARFPRFEWDSRPGDLAPCEHYEWVAP